MKKETDYIELMNIQKNYSSFNEFYNSEQHNIFLKIVEIFEASLKENKEKELIVVARINNAAFDTSFEINRNNKDILQSTINPYFEKISEYEVCARVRDLDFAFSRLTSPFLTQAV